MIYLVEIDTYDLRTDAIEKRRFGTAGFSTLPSDSPANIYFEERLTQPGNYERYAFANGTTSGESDVSFGFIELANADGGLDYLNEVAVDGRELKIYGLESRMSSWSSRQLLFIGTMEQVELSWTTVSIRIKDRLFELRKNIQDNLYLGTTTAGGQNTAEGTADDIKDRPKPFLFGKALNFAPILANRFDRIYQVNDGPINAGIIVRDVGVPLTFAANYDTIAQLRSATIAGGSFATARALGLFRIGANPQGDITVDSSEGADGSRSAPRTIQRLLLGFGLTTDDFSVADLETLHALNPAEVGIWTGAETYETLSIVSQLLDSIGATCVPDRLGVLRFFRLDIPTGQAVATFDRSIILDKGNGIERLATNDDGRGVPAKKVTIKYAYNYTIQTGVNLAGSTTDAQKAFAKEQWRTAVAEDATVSTKFLLAPELEFETMLVNLADAQAEANRRLNIYKVRRDRYRIPIKTDYVSNIDLGSVISLSINRFGLSAGKKFLVIGINENYRTGITTLDVFG